MIITSAFHAAYAVHFYAVQTIIETTVMSIVASW